MENQEISGREMDLEPRRNRSFWLQTRALLRKNLLMKWRQRWSTLAEILLPVLIMGILVPIRVKAPKEFVPADLHTFNTSHFNQFGSAWALSAYLEKTDSIIGIAPDNEFNRKIAQLLPKVAFNLRHRIRLFESNEAVEKYVSDKRYPDYEEFKPLKAAVIIEKGELYKFNLTIRMNGTGFPPDAPLTSGPAVNKLQVGFNPSNFFIYLARSFAMIQDIFEEAIIYLTRLELGKPPDYRPWSKSIAFRPFPNDDYNQDLFGDAIRSNIGLFLTIAYLWPVTRILRALVGEKESRMSEIMKIMGLYEWSLFVSWLVTYLIISAVQALLIAGITYGTVFAYSNPFLIFLYFFSFGISVFCFSNFLSAFFSKANLASTFGAIIFFLTFFVYLAENSSDSHSVYIKLATCLVPSVCVAHGASPLFDLESASIGLQFSNIFETFDSFKVAYTILMLLFDSLIFLILGGYFKQVFPGSFGIGRRWYFPFESIINLCADKSKTGRRYSSYAPLLSTNIDPDDVSMEVCEEDSLKIEHVDANGKTVGVRIRNLRKDFSREGMENLIAVNNLSLDVYEDQVLALLVMKFKNHRVPSILFIGFVIRAIMEQERQPH